ncbi:WD40 repeat-like protein [Bimuria novae-zelandiae CBS 107.79]|uniref:Mitochondrial division protein 1 n=1 Tax=Bimuria novae-zelandiae CBS 107.79 TaxID=1447943 RepID=A0A6A5UWH6_9PLEO|nr:WD40 repeat-like protein [Bimuria novae-zelandiae CBS 107.79]
MRLLRRSNTGEFSLTQFRDETIPPYAILSHTWGADTEEVTFEDLTNGSGKDKPGYEKIRFCGEQATLDNLEYFWIDTCCIDKANKAELSQAINSMFRWYGNATRCYVYLLDVSSTTVDANEEFNPPLWESDLRKSKWFTRGWTLQELLAPSSVEFFSRERRRLGDKNILSQKIHEITGIPELALDRTPLSRFSVNERLSWIEHRHTRLEEDRAYSLLGIFGVYVAPIYGEGTASAFQRLREEIGKLEQCMQDLHLTDPRDDKKRIEDTKGGLLKDSYRWILGNADFQRWRDDQQSRMLWIKGDPGKGKTMLLCGIANELTGLTTKTALLSYFFCQATDSRINSATAVLRGLLYMLVHQQPSLVSHVRKKHDHAGKALFEDANSWVALSEIFTDVLQDPSLKGAYLMVDALDECATGMPKLLDFIVQTSCMPARVKWIVTSRNWPDIEERIERAGQKVKLSLELNAASVSTAVQFYIRYRVAQLVLDKGYKEKEKNAVLAHLLSNANDTFLWVALACQNLDAIPRWKVLAKLEAFPPGLDALYNRMMQQISSSDDADLCKRILALIVTVYRPITLDELTYLCKPLEDMADDLASVQQIVGLCGSFLTIRSGTVYFVHQSAKDFLCTKAASVIFPSGTKEIHRAIFSRSLQVMSKTLQRDMYGLRALGYPADQVEPPVPDPLAASRYSCIYWVDHLSDWNHSCPAHDMVPLQDQGPVDNFLRTKYLYWLEALSLCKSMPKGVVAMANLETLMRGRADAAELTELVRDAHRFIMAHKGAIENSPLQAYASALVFSPPGSLISGHFKDEDPQWIIIEPSIGDKWGACLQTLEGHSDWVGSVAFSHDSTRLASGSADNTVKVWDVGSGDCLQTLKGHRYAVISVAFSHDSTRLASASYDNTVKIWDASSGECLQTLKEHRDWVMSVAFSHDSMRLASVSLDKTIRIWDTGSGACLRTLKGHRDGVISVAFSHDSARLASASHDCTVKIWDAGSGACLRTIEGHHDRVISVAFSHDSTRLASGSADNTVKVWDVGSGNCLQIIKGHHDRVIAVAFSHDSAWLASASGDRTVKVWDADSSDCLQIYEGHFGSVMSVVFSRDSTRLASASADNTVKVWDASSGDCLQALERHSDEVISVTFSHDSAWLASGSRDRTVKIWDASSSKCLQTFEGHSGGVTSVAFSHDSARLASGSYQHEVKIWDAGSGDCLQTFKGHFGSVMSVVFSHNSAQLASAGYDDTVRIWDVSSGDCLQTLYGHRYAVVSVAFSHDSMRLASASLDKTVKIWDAGSGACLQALEGHSDEVISVAFSHDSAQLASGSRDRTVKIWDASSSKCLQTLNIGKALYHTSFDITSSYLQTEIGIIYISVLSTSVTLPANSVPQYKGVGLSSDGRWITYNSEKLVWLPSEHRPSCSMVSGGMIGIGVGNGRVWICKVKLEAF